MADRARLLAEIPLDGARGFEVGALMSPFLDRATHDVLIVDRLAADDLARQYAAEAATAGVAVAPVDVALGDRSLAEALGDRAPFDFAIASHVIEHVPDIVGWLSDVADLVRVGGHLILVVPDKRYTFDHLRESSRLAEMIAPWIERRRTPSAMQVFDYLAHAAAVDKTAAWAGPIDAESLVPYIGARGALERAVAVHASGEYSDSHCWVVTPRILLERLAQLTELGLLRWELQAFFGTRPGEEDFGLVLRRSLGAPDSDGFRRAMPLRDDVESIRLRAEIAALRASRSWRLTAPLRRLRSLGRR